jgi:hypothetical protein
VEFSEREDESLRTELDKSKSQEYLGFKIYENKRQW